MANKPIHKDLSDPGRAHIEFMSKTWAAILGSGGESLAIAREAMINAFDEEAAKLEALHGED